MNKKIGEQFAMMNEISAQISDKTFDKFVEEAEVKLEEGRGEILSENKYDWDFTCTKMPDENEEVA